MKHGEQAVRKFQRKEEVAREGRQGLFPTSPALPTPMYEPVEIYQREPPQTFL